MIGQGAQQYFPHTHPLDLKKIVQVSPLHIEEDQQPMYDEYADSDWYDIEVALKSPFQAARAMTIPPPKPPDPT